MADFKKIIKEVSGKDPLSSFKLTYDAQTNQIEPVYYWLLDFVKDAGYDVEKIVDNFTTTPGSGHFDEFGRKKGTLQEKVSTYLGAINQVIKSIINLLYDLKEFEIRLKHYEKAKSEKKEEREAGMLALKQIWMDNVDIKKGRGSINQMSFELGFTTLRDAFMVCNSIEDVKKNEVLNDQVKRILIPRLSEFLEWKELSEKELRNRYEIEKNYLRSQVETVKLYSSWISPYLKALEQLNQTGNEKDPSLVNAFSTSIFELTILGKKKIKPESISNFSKHFPRYIPSRDYFACVLISFNYRGHYSQRVSQRGDMAFGFGGRVDITFESYALNSEELDLIKKKFEKANLDEGIRFFEKNTNQSLETLKEELEHFLGNEKKEKKETKSEEDINPFSALFSIFSGLFRSSGKKEKKKIEKPEDIRKDNYIEEIIRQSAAESAKAFLYSVYDVYKKAHAMASSPENFDY
ncbi:MAG: hypothetical protein QXX68_00275 [Candidatus Pacearchaeota archaeon]